MAKSRRSSTENIFKQRNEAKVQPQTKEIDSEPEKEEVEEVKQPTEEKSTSAPVKPVKSASSKAQSSKASTPDKVDRLFKDSKKEHGVQRTTYYEKDVYDYVEGISKQYGINFNKVVNQILRDYMVGE